ncbi:hypothetical protein J6590_002451 [Homalodisca vitripennis]|nr:hypothetical protein J6590_002451 [Homalodisca vitripennis]
MPSCGSALSDRDPNIGQDTRILGRNVELSGHRGVGWRDPAPGMCGLAPVALGHRAQPVTRHSQITSRPQRPLAIHQIISGPDNPNWALSHYTRPGPYR